MCKTQPNPKLRHTYACSLFDEMLLIRKSTVGLPGMGFIRLSGWILLRFFQLKNWHWNPMCHSLVIYCVKVHFWWITGKKWLSTTLVSVVLYPFSFFFSTPDSCKLTLSSSKRWSIWLLKSKWAPTGSTHHTSAVACRCRDIRAA